MWRLSLESHTTYTLWSRGRLLGQSDLSYVRCIPLLRTGDFFPTEIGDKLMPVVTGVRTAVVNHTRRFNEAYERGEVPESDDATEHADIAAAQMHFEALELELRASDGCVIPTESIDVRDNELTLSFANDIDVSLPDPLFAETEEDKQLLADIEHDAALLEEWFGPDWDDDTDDRPWEAHEPFPRYQIYVELLEETAIP